MNTIVNTNVKCADCGEPLPPEWLSLTYLNIFKIYNKKRSGMSNKFGLFINMNYAHKSKYERSMIWLESSM